MNTTESKPSEGKPRMVRVHESVRPFLREILEKIDDELVRAFDGFHDDEVPRSFFDRIPYQWTTDLDYLCAVDGLSRLPRSRWPDLRWRSYLDNLRFPVLARKERSKEPGSSGYHEDHVRGVRAMYFHLRNPEAVHDALMAIYDGKLVLPPCSRRIFDQDTKALLSYTDWVDDDSKFIRVARRRGLRMPLPWQPKLVVRELPGCGDVDRCIACRKVSPERCPKNLLSETACLISGNAIFDREEKTCAPLELLEHEDLMTDRRRSWREQKVQFGDDLHKILTAFKGKNENESEESDDVDSSESCSIYPTQPL